MKKINRLIEECKGMIINHDNRESIQALYIGGSIKPQDRVRDSDIDIIGIVFETFPEDLEAKINIELKETILNMKCKLRVLYLSELQGGNQKGFISKLLPVKLFIRRIPFFPLIWENPLKIEATIGSYTIIEEIEVQTTLLKKYINNLDSINNKSPFEWIPKAILYLAALELELIKKAEYTTSFSEIQNEWNDHKNHIVHDSIQIRQNNYEISDSDKEKYITKAFNYMENIKVLTYYT